MKAACVSVFLTVAFAFSAHAVVGGFQENDPQVLNAVFKFSKYGAQGGFTCSAVNLGGSLVLTAAHCAPDRARPFISGLSDSNSHFIGVGANTGYALFNPNFDASRSVQDDIALLKVDVNSPSAPAIPSRSLYLQRMSNYPRFELPKTATDGRGLPDELYLSGWGFQSYRDWRDAEYQRQGEISAPVRLRSMKIDTKKQILPTLNADEVCRGMGAGISRDVCDRWVQDRNAAIAANKVFCFKTAHAGADAPLPGDSGGPLYSKDPGGRLTVWGISSNEGWDSNKRISWFCYTNVSKYLSWIPKP